MRYTVDGDVCHSSYSQVGLLWSRGRALLLRLLCGLQVEHDKTPNLDKPQDMIKPNLYKAIKTRQDITGGTRLNTTLTLTRQFKSGYDKRLKIVN